VGRTVRLLKAVHCLEIRAAEFSCCLGYASKCWMHSGHTFALVKEQQQLIHFSEPYSKGFSIFESPYSSNLPSVHWGLCHECTAVLLKQNVKDMTAKL
jgi:hypothetical protein